MKTKVLLGCIWLSIGMTSCVVPHLYTEFTGDIAAKNKDHVVYLSGVKIKRGPHDGWIYAGEGPGPGEHSDRADEPNGFYLFPSYIDCTDDRHPTSFTITHMEVTVDERLQPPFVRFQCAPPESTRSTTYEYRVPGSADFSKADAPKLKPGDYEVKVHYVLDGQEYDATWKFRYRRGVGTARLWEFTTS